MQTSLFSSAQDEQNAALDSLAGFRFDESLRALARAKSIEPGIANNAHYQECAGWLKQSGLSTESNGVDIADIWLELKARQRAEGRKTVRRDTLFYLLASRLLDLDCFDASGLVIGARGFIHESACLIHLNRHKAAYSLLLDATEQFGDQLPAQYWGYLGDAATRMGLLTQANTAYLKLLLVDPSVIDWATCAREDFLTVFSEIAAQSGIEEAYCSLAFATWQAGLLEVPRGNSYIAPLLGRVLAQPAQVELFDQAKRRLLFTLYAFTEQSHPTGRIDAASRAMMRNLDRSLFATYINTLTAN